MSTASSVGCPRLIGSPTARRGSPRSSAPSAPSPPRPTARGGGAPPGMAHLAVHLAADGAAPTTAPLRTSFVLCIRPADASPSAARRRRPTTYGQPEKLPTANEFGDRSAEIAAAAAAVAWDEETVLRQLRALGASDAAARGRRPDVYFTHGSLKPILAEGALPATLASLPASQILLLAVSCGVRAAEVSLGDGGVALPRGAAAERLDALLARGDATELFAALAAVAAEGGDGGGRQLGRGERGAARGRRRGGGGAGGACPSDLRAVGRPPSRGVERKWGGALKRLRANDESLTELRLSAAPRQRRRRSTQQRWSMRSRRRRRRGRRAAATAAAARRRRSRSSSGRASRSAARRRRRRSARSSRSSSRR